MKNSRLSWPVLFLALAATPSITSAQSQTQQSTDATSKNESLADAARKAREQKKALPKPAHVWNDDNIPKQGDGVNVVGSTETSAPTPEEASAPQPVSVRDRAQLENSIQQAKEKVAGLEQDVDLAQRKFSLDSDMYYSKTNFQDDKAGKAALDAEQADVTNKKQQLKDARDILAALQAKLSPSSDQKKPQ